MSARVGWVMAALAAFSLIAVSACMHRPENGGEGDGPGGRDEDARVLQIAVTELDRIDIPAGDRRTTIAYGGEEAVVTFHLPEGLRGGDFIVRIDRVSGRVVDVKIWR